MADIKKVVASDGVTYDIADATARAGLSSKQDTLVSGTNIKTINNTSLLGSGNIDISSGSSDILWVTLTFNLTYSADVTYADIWTAIVAGKYVVVRTRGTGSNWSYFPLWNHPQTSGDQLYFANVSTNGVVQYFHVTSSNYWQFDSLDLAPLDSPALYGTPTAPTQAAGNSSTRIATTAFVQGEIDSITPDDISAAPLYAGPYLNASSASYRIFGHATINTTSQASPFQFLVGCLTSLTGQNQGLYLVEGSNRSSSVSIRITALRKTGASNFTFGYYISNGEYYLGVYTSTTYANSPKTLVFHNPPRCTWTFDDSIAASSTAPTGWTTISSGALATTDDIDTAIGSAILASY